MNRTAMLQAADDASVVWDLIVIGGGATGLGVALDAAARGHRTLLFEQGDFAEGTSSRSTKLVHGGVRYLRNGEFGLVRDSLRERGRLLRNAPRLVKPLGFIVPAYRWHERLTYGAGLTAYDWLSGSLGIGRTRHLSREEVSGRLPQLRRRGLRGGTLYWDGQFDDARLAVALARTAADRGATLLNHVRVVELVKEGGRIRGVVAGDGLGGGTIRARARVVVNATGVFADAVRHLDEPDAPTVIEPSQGIHLVLDREFLGGETAVMIPKTDDGRVLFAIPWHGRLVVGTTDTAGVPVSLNPRPLEPEIDYLLEHAGRYLERAPSRSDIRATFAGLRPLVKPRAVTGATAGISRDHSLFVSGAGLVTITGGKWTTYRKMAEEAVDRAEAVGGLPGRPCRTADLSLADRPAAEDMPVEDPSWTEPLVPGLPWTVADVVAAARHEMAATVDDVLARRTRVAFLDEAAARRCAPRVAELLAAHGPRPGGGPAGQRPPAPPGTRGS